MIFQDGATIPDTMLIGITTGQWPVKLFYDSREQAAEWLAERDPDGRRRHVFRVRLEPIEKLTYVPAVPATLDSAPLSIDKNSVVVTGRKVAEAIKSYKENGGKGGL